MKRSLNDSAALENLDKKELCYHYYSVIDPDSQKPVCSPGPALNSSHVCQKISEGCSYFRLGQEKYQGSYTEFSDCQCGVSESGNAYCPFKAGDDQFTKSL